MVKIAFPLQYRLQLLDGNWTEWRFPLTPITEDKILAIETSETITKNHPEYLKYKQLICAADWKIVNKNV